MLPRDTGTQRCNGGTYPWSIGSQWPAVAGDHIATKIVGYARSSGLACGDNPLSHDYFHERNGCAFFEHFLDHHFASDWNVHIAPIAPYGGWLTRGQFEAASPDLEIEFEEYYAQYFFVGWGWPVAGDLVHVIGRWITDCGHNDPFYRNEIHPPFAMAHVRTMPDRSCPAPASTCGRTDALASVAEIWVNGYFPGFPVEIELWPPPRPSPDAILAVRKPMDTDAALGVAVAFSIGNASVKIRFTAPERRVPVDGNGKMNWQTGRGYNGEWRAYWTR